MREFQALTTLLFAWSISMVAMFLFIGFFAYWIKYHPRLARKLSKKFALLPVIDSQGKLIWGKFYYQYQEYEAGMVLGGSIQRETYGKKITWSGSGSFIPSYKTYFIGQSSMGVRKHLKSEGWTGKLAQKRQQEQNLKNWEKLLGPKLFQEFMNDSK